MLKVDITKYRNFHEYFEDRTEALGEKICLTDGERSEVSYSYVQLNEKVNQTASLLREIGIGKGDRFATLMQNCPEFFLLYLASMKIGALIMPLFVDLPLNEVVMLIKEFEIKALFVDRERADVALEAKRKDNGILGEICIINSQLQDFHKILSGFDKCPLSSDQVRMDDPGSLYFSSGTTGEPKGIPQSPKNLLTAAYGLAKAYGFGENDTQMGILPIHHTALATYGFWPSICAGSNFVLFKKFSKTNFWRNIAEHQIVFVETVPTILSMLLNPPEDISGYDLTKLRFIGCGSAPLPVELHRRFEDTFGVLVANKYGLSETAPTHFNPPQWNLRKEGSIGKTLPMCEAKIYDESDRELSPKAIGEIVIRGDNVISSYYRSIEEDQEVFRNGWFHTGDLGYVDKDGFFFLVGRKKDIIIRGGANVYPNEVDNVLFSNPLITEAGAFGVPDKIYGEEVMACVVPKKGCRVKEEVLMKYCKKYLPEYKCPKRIYLVDSIPRTASGKIMRRELSEKCQSLTDE